MIGSLRTVRAVVDLGGEGISLFFVFCPFSALARLLLSALHVTEEFLLFFPLWSGLAGAF